MTMFGHHSSCRPPRRAAECEDGASAPDFAELILGRAARPEDSIRGYLLLDGELNVGFHDHNKGAAAKFLFRTMTYDLR
jgi:hypothetical protein